MSLLCPLSWLGLFLTSPSLASKGPVLHASADPHGEHDASADAHTHHRGFRHKPRPAHSHKHDAHGEVHWDYQGPLGPEHWGELSPEWAQCGSGRAQTPIDIDSRYAEPIGLDDVVFHYHPLSSRILNNGHTLQVNLPEGDTIELDGGSFQLVQFHFHAPSEHRLDGKQFPMELHLVHKDDRGHLAVVAIFLEEGAESPALDPVFDAMDLDSGQEKPIPAPVDAASFVPSDHAMIRYTGSLTTPPCSEGVRWIVFTHPVSATREQMSHFKKLYDHNARPIQALNGRPLLQDATH